MQEPRTISLAFEDVPSPGFTQLHDFLAKNYDICSTSEHVGGWLLADCRDVVPSIAERPFFIGGRAVTWTKETQLIDFPFDVVPGFYAIEHHRYLVLGDDDILEDLNIKTIPKAETLSRILNNCFPEANAITYFYSYLLVEFDEVPREQLIERMDQFPMEIAYTDVQIQLCNGPLYGAHPTATRPFQGWGRKVPSDLEVEDGHLNATPEDWEHGRVVKRVTTRLDDPDSKPISTRYVNLSNSPSIRLDSDEITTVDELFWVENEDGTPELLISRGRRVVKRRALGAEDAFVEHVQGIFLTETTEIVEDSVNNELLSQSAEDETGPTV